MMMCPAGSGVVDVRVLPAWGVVVICRWEGRVMLERVQLQRIVVGGV